MTGTDTSVGKTLVSCALLQAFAAKGKRAAGFKPVAAGCDEDGHNDDVRLLLASSNVPATCGQINPYCFPQPIAPHLAARHAGVRIEFSSILSSYRELAGRTDEVIVEGVGGFCVPLNNEQNSADLAKQLDLPVILVVGMRLGCLNHALLTMRAIADYQLECAGWVANVLDVDGTTRRCEASRAGMPSLQENIEALRQRIAAPLLGMVPYQSQPDACAAAAHLNLDLLEKK